MATSYPTAIDSGLPAEVGAAADPLNNPPHDTHHTNVADAMVAVQTILGINPQGDQATVKAFIESVRTLINNHTPDGQAHGAVATATPSTIVWRDTAGRAKVAIPTTADDIARLDTVTGHADATTAHGASIAPTANRIILRDSVGRAQVAAPAANNDIARLDTVNNHIAAGHTMNNWHGRRMTTDFNVPNNFETKMEWNDPTPDDADFSLNAAKTHVTLLKAGYYEITLSIRWQSSSTGHRVGVLRGANDDEIYRVTGPPGLGGYIMQAKFPVRYLGVNNPLSIGLYQDSGADLLVRIDNSTHLDIRKVAVV